MSTAEVGVQHHQVLVVAGGVDIAGGQRRLRHRDQRVRRRACSSGSGRSGAHPVASPPSRPGRPGPRVADSAVRARSSAATSNAPSSAGSRADSTSIPSSSQPHRACRRVSCASRVPARLAVAADHPLQLRRRVHQPLLAAASARRPAPATRVNARIFEYDNRPRANAASSAGTDANAGATRTYSRAAPGPTEHAHDSQCAHDLIPHCAHPLRASNSAINRSHSRVDAANRPASEQIRSSNSSNGTSAPGMLSTRGVAIRRGRGRRRDG